MFSWKKNRTIIISAGIGVILLVIVLAKLPLKDVLASFNHVSLVSLAKYLIVLFIMLIIGAFRWWVVLYSQGANLPFRRLFAYRFVGSAMSYLTPGPRVGGEAFQAATMKREKIPFTQAFSSVVIDKTVELSTSGVFFFIGVIIALLTLPVGWKTRVIFLITGFFMLLFIFFFFRQMFRGKSFFHRIFRILRLNKIRRLEQGEQRIIDFEQYIIRFYQKDKLFFMVTIILSFFTWVCMFFEYHYLLQMFGIHATAGQIFLIVSFVGFAYMLPMPMALGTLEAGQASAFTIINASAAIGVATALVIRAKDIVYSIIGLSVMGYYGITRKDVKAAKRDKKAEYIREITKVKAK